MNNLQDIEEEINNIKDLLCNDIDDLNELNNIKNSIILCKNKLLLFKPKVNIVTEDGDKMNITDKIKKQYLLSNINCAIDWSSLYNKYLNEQYNSMIIHSSLDKLKVKDNINIKSYGITFDVPLTLENIKLGNVYSCNTTGLYNNRFEAYFDNDNYLCYVAIEYNNNCFLGINSTDFTFYVNNDYCIKPTLWKTINKENITVNNILQLLY